MSATDELAARPTTTSLAGTTAPGNPASTPAPTAAGKPSPVKTWPVIGPLLTRRQRVDPGARSSRGSEETARGEQERLARAKARAKRLHAHQRRARQRTRIALLNRLGRYDFQLRAAVSTTRQAGALHLGTSSAPTSHRGMFVGRDWHHRWAVFLDPFTAYRDGILKNPNIAVVGDIGAGKSSLVKTWLVIRMLLMGRRVVVVDKKSQRRADGTEEGEYSRLARDLGVTPVRFVTGKDSTGSRINPLDPAVGAGRVSHYQLTRAILTEALGRAITPLEGKALRIAIDVAIAQGKADGRQATIREVIAHLSDPTAQAGRRLSRYETLADLASWGREAAAELERMVEEDLAGLIDGPTSPEINLGAGLMVFDISALPDDGPAVAIVMAIVNTWTRGTLSAQADSVPTVLVVDEASLVMQGAFAKVTRRNQKVSRGQALCNVSAMQHASDIPAHSPAISTLREAGTVVVYRQEKPDEARWCTELFGLPSQCAGLIQNLDDGAALIRIGQGKPFVVSHLRSGWETEVSNTDDAMVSAATIALNDQVVAP